MKHTIKNMAFQGDVCFRRIDKLPESVKESTTPGRIVVAHSETGHHHAIERDESIKLFEKLERDPMVCYLQISDGFAADVVHHRPTDTHATLTLTPGCWEVLRQEEYTPQGWRRVED